MGLLDQVISAAGGLSGPQGSNGNVLLDAVMQMLNSPNVGGIAGLVQAFQKGNLGDVANSWVGTGNNLPVSATQLQQVLGGDTIGQLARHLGVGHDQAAGNLAEYLPKVIDMLTPGGNIPANQDLLAQGMSLLKDKLFG